ncbi:sugar ABC transporter substrate-binding protein [Spongiactinospora sp. TRM90649]|uniref:ABC transporter substrate-binding protein n=1 Tax=Spongiactinospora sp. TRM90649 TaxID=3031114 RepID=UPI0023F9A97C|nr:sugar ABC transporter substrate-binding protein [Spongiactinospora sp. TRM90649]MDF5758320.1 sugar ABC transporter substrate-binding protein [Spongiactinospora sp. TRM90649]
MSQMRDMRMSRRGLLRATGGLAATAVLAACGSGESGGSGTGGGGGAKGTLTLWASTAFAGDAQAALRKAAEEYGGKQGLTIKVEGFPANDLAKKITTALAGGGGPDLVVADVSAIPQFAASKMLVDVTSRIKPVAADFFPGNVAAATFQGATYAVPFDTSNVALLWNKKLFEKAGIQQAPGTWDDLVSSAKELTGGGQHGYMLGAQGYGSFLFWPWLWQNGGRILDDAGTKALFNGPEGLEAWSFYANLHLTHGVVPPTFLGVTQAWDQYIQPFLTEKVAMLAIGDWGLAPIAKGNPGLEYGVAPLPKGKEGATVLGGNAVAITSACKNVDAAWGFVSWLTSAEQEKVLRDGYQRIPARTDVSNGSMSGLDEAHQVFIQQAATARARPAVTAWGDIEWQVMANAWDTVIQKKKSPEQALNEAATAATQALSRG